MILNFIKKELPKTPNPQQLIKVFKKLRKDLFEIMNDPYEKKAMEYFDFISWLDSKIKNKPFVDIIKEKARKDGIWLSEKRRDDLLLGKMIK